VNDYIFDGCYVLLGEDGTVMNDDGSPMIQYVYGKFWVNNHAHILTGKKGLTVELLMMFLEQLDISKVVTGAVQAKVNQTNLKSMKIVLPSREIVIMLNEKLAPLFNQYRHNLDCNKLLNTMRDSLLPRLMSGKIDVSKLDLSN